MNFILGSAGSNAKKHVAKNIFGSNQGYALLAAWSVKFHDNLLGLQIFIWTVVNLLSA